MVGFRGSGLALVEVCLLLPDVELLQHSLFAGLFPVQVFFTQLPTTSGRDVSYVCNWTSTLRVRVPNRGSDSDR